MATKTPTTFSILAEVEWEFQGGEEDVNWRFLNEHAAFKHRDACEFILHIGVGTANEDNHWGYIAEAMHKFGCTPDFIDAYLAAKNAGAMRVMFWS